MNDILIKQFMKSFELNRLEAGLIQSAYYIGYFCWLSGRLLMRRFDISRAGDRMMLFSLGALLFWPRRWSGSSVCSCLPCL